MAVASESAVMAEIAAELVPFAKVKVCPLLTEVPLTVKTERLVLLLSAATTR